MIENVSPAAMQLTIAISTCETCSKLGDAIATELEAATAGYCDALARLDAGEYEYDAIYAEFLAEASKTRLCETHAAAHARLAMTGIPYTGESA